jgi:hypothetical protein
MVAEEPFHDDRPSLDLELEVGVDYADDGKGEDRDELRGKA